MPTAKKRIPALSARGFWLCVAGLAAVKLALASFQTAYIWVGGAPLDDELMFRAANAISAGDWLGAYDYLTLSKSMFFAVWLALLNALHLPYLVTGQALWCAAALLASQAFWPWLQKAGRGNWARLAVFAALAFNPAVSAAYSLRVYRDNIFPALCLVCFAGFRRAVARAVFAPHARRRPWLLSPAAAPSPPAAWVWPPEAFPDVVSELPPEHPAKRLAAMAPQSIMVTTRFFIVHLLLIFL